ncbi:SPBc2 prophage-derived aminoglycoside N(3')-acetyltransferase-like protein YokD [compost metagenome]
MMKIEKNGLQGKIICLHSSLKSFGEIEGGIKSIVDVFLEADCTLIVPTFTYDCETSQPAERRIERNGYDDHATFDHAAAFDLDKRMISTEMGAIPKYIIHEEQCYRSEHPLNSFAVIGKKAKEIISKQTFLNVYGHYKYIYEMEESYLILAGVGLNSATPIHYAEERAGRVLFRRWAKHKDNETIEVEVGSCSEGFPNMEKCVEGIKTEEIIGNSHWSLFKFKPFIDEITEAIINDNEITKCEDSHCPRCKDAIAGGPIL